MAVAVTLGAAALLVTGCSAGQTAQTATQKSTVDGTAGTAGDIALRYVRLAYPEGGRYRAGDTATLEFFAVNSGPMEDRLVRVRADGASQVTMHPAESGAASGSASLTPSGAGTVTASGATPTPPGTAGGTPTGSATGAGSATVTPTENQPGTVTAPAGPAQVPVPVPPHSLVVFDGGGATVQLVGLTQELLSGQTVPITFSFARGGMLTLDVPVATSLKPLSKSPPAPTSTATSTAAP
jgi:copper(I)-binding protein